MSALLAELEQQACTLLPDERAQLVEVLLESLQGSSLSEIGTEWEREVEKRVAAFDRGELQTTPAEEIFAEARRMTQ
ncbi:MAG: addiction module antitoxin RelB [Hydrogenophilales bacterium CG_4_9_14_3_um_filter_59_35]|nr:MAG: addiction module antitoxin RelB [Hydrogenophilales bacterium CG18_big_fil_WC_8_21_14_2_50_58_12]PIX98874.1 MAG: addiction module antitoxin RelB [Hydrogenophilales bacterium CG_4_10_14_3_um_filter_58_23]PJB04717.1 MAG: addiction module antitoxin RelB [Hydrogenophilales bacterium CG_4_9_14_3_um_filter_59_35]